MSLRTRQRDDAELKLANRKKFEAVVLQIRNGVDSFFLCKDAIKTITARLDLVAKKGNVLLHDRGDTTNFSQFIIVWDSFIEYIDLIIDTPFLQSIEAYLVEQIEAAKKAMDNFLRFNSKDTEERTIAIEKQARLFAFCFDEIKGFEIRAQDQGNKCKKSVVTKTENSITNLLTALANDLAIIWKSALIPTQEMQKYKIQISAHLNNCCYALSAPSKFLERANRHNFWVGSHHVKFFSDLLFTSERELAQIFPGFPIKRKAYEKVSLSEPEKPFHRSLTLPKIPPIPPSSDQSDLIRRLKKEIEQLKTRIEELQEELQSMRLQSGSSASNIILEQEARLAETEKKLAEAQLNDLCHDNARLKGLVDALTLRLTTRDGQSELEAAELARVRREKEDIEFQCQDLKREFEREKSRRKTLIRLVDLDDTLNSPTPEDLIGAYRKLFHENQLLQEQNEKNLLEIDSLKRSTTRQRRYKEGLIAAYEVIQSMEQCVKELEQTKQSLSTVQKQLAETQQTHDSQIHKIKKENSKAVQILRQDLDDEREAHEATERELEKKKSQIKTLTEDLKQTRDELQELSKTTSHETETKGELEKRLDKFKAQIKQLTQELNESEETKAELEETLNQQTQEIQKMKTSNSAEIQNLKNQVDQLTKKLQQVQDEKQELQDQIAELNKKSHGLQIKLVNFKTQEEKVLQEKIDNLTQEKVEHEEKIEILAQENENHQQQIEVLTQEKIENQEKIQNLSQAKIEHKEKIELLAQENEKHQQQIEAMTQEKVENQEKIQNLAQEKTKYKNDVKALQEHVQQLEQEKTALLQDNSQLMDKTERDKRKHRKQSAMEEKQLQDKIDELQAKLAAMEGELAKNKAYSHRARDTVNEYIAANTMLQARLEAADHKAKLHNDSLQHQKLHQLKKIEIEYAVMQSEFDAADESTQAIIINDQTYDRGDVASKLADMKSQYNKLYQQLTDTSFDEAAIQQAISKKLSDCLKDKLEITMKALRDLRSSHIQLVKDYYKMKLGKADQPTVDLVDELSTEKESLLILQREITDIIDVIEGDLSKPETDDGEPLVSRLNWIRENILIMRQLYAYKEQLNGIWTASDFHV